MSPPSDDLWFSAKDALRAAKTVLSVSPDSAASRAYYAAFYAVSAMFALEGKTFRKHSAIEAAVHRDLVRPGRWDVELGQEYSKLLEARNVGDYSVGQHVTGEEAEEAIQIAGDILRAVSQANPEEFTGLDEI